MYEGGPLLQIDLGGSIQRHPRDLGPDVTALAREYLGEEARVRITYRHEMLLR